MTYVVPKNVVVQMGTVDANTLCGLPCEFYLDYNNLNNLPPSVPVADPWQEGDVLQFNNQGDMIWAPAQLKNGFIDGGAAATVFTPNLVTEINGGGA